MKRICLTIVLVCPIVLGSVSSLEARQFALGVIFGEPPTGLSVMLWLGPKVSLDAAFAWASSGGDTRFRFHVDALFHTGSRLRSESGGLTFYYGLGVRHLQMDERTGLRLPLGLRFLLDVVPLELFAEFVPTLDLAPNTEFLLRFAGGLRIYLF